MTTLFFNSERDMQSIFFVNSSGEMIIPSHQVLKSVLDPIRKLPILFSKEWDAALTAKSCDMPVYDCIQADVPRTREYNNVVYCNSHNLWKRFLRADVVVVNGAALRVWKREYSLNSKPMSTLVIITEGVLDPSAAGYDLKTMEMKYYPISFIEL